ncbi:MAG TPA: phospholipase D-like domain-containing protein [Gaiellaceae bacterium]|nr:phospholipase D-like domain-containing protein [Gaiellaceae bacterium]
MDVVRRRASSGGVTVQAIAGNHAVFLGLDLDESARDGCLGFAVHRTDHTEHEGYWLAGFKTFESVVPKPDPHVVYRTLDHPLQTFYWGDYSAKPAHDYSYRIVPRYGAPAALENRAGVEATVDVSTSDPGKGMHGIYFNRGVAASQAYTLQFGKSPDKLAPAKREAALKWLSRGLFEAILAYIGQAAGADFALRAAVYEFTQPDVLAAFLAAHENGADVRIVYHALDDEAGNANRDAIAAAGLPDAILKARTHAAIAHNKFIVLCRKHAVDLEPVTVWTGSTNLSEGGIFGHSNVGHEVRDPDVAARYLEVWAELHDDPEQAPLRDWVSEKSPFDPDAPPAPGVQTIFSPRHGLAPLRSYASRFGGASVSAHITGPFGLNTLFENALTSYTGDALHYVLLDQADNNQAAWSTSHRVFVSVGSEGGPDELSRWAHEHLTGFNVHVPYLHTKILLLDPTTAEPTVITGSANFSPDSTSSNDENMLVVPADLEVADVYLTEYARIFNHFYARFWASELGKDDHDPKTHSFLEETPDWQKPYFAHGNPKPLQRVLYSSLVAGND